MVNKMIFLILILLAGTTRPLYAITEDSTSFGVFGRVKVYQGSGDPVAVVLFISGDGGWNKGVIDMARILASMDVFVAGIDIVRYYAALRKSGHECYYPASDFENLSLFIQKKYRMKDYRKPILVGYSSGATLAYAILAQAPANTFKGAISLGFCPDIEIDRPLCEGSGLKSRVLKPGKSFYLNPDSKLFAPIYVLQGTIDQVCSHQLAVDYFNGVPNAEVISLPGVGHGFSVEKNWVPQFRQAFEKIMKTPAMFGEARQSAPAAADIYERYREIEQLPLLAYPSVTDPREPLVLMISGDGGWTSWDESLAREIVARHIPVVALDAQKYFWERKDPAQVTQDMEKVLDYYLKLWGKDSYYLVGYSFGADVAPFIATRLKPPYSGQVKKVVMMSPDPMADFEIHISDMLSMESSSDVYDVPGEARKLKNIEIECIFGDSEEEDARKPFEMPSVRIETLPGSHHYGNRFPELAGLIAGASAGKKD